MRIPPNKGKSRIWNYETVAILRRLYPTTPAQDIADIIGCSDTTVHYKAKQLGIKRVPSFHRNNFIGRYTGKGHYKDPEDL
jgi:hypothetical protein